MKRQRAFRFGVIDENSLSREEWVQKAQRVEHLGYSTFLIRDHFIQGDFKHQLAPIPALMAAADVTKKLRVGSLVFANDYRHPVVLAKEAATLDLLSGGRFELGIGAGWLRSEYEQTGIPFDPPGIRVERMQEALSGAWRGYDAFRDYALNETPFINPKAMLRHLSEENKIQFQMIGPPPRRGSFQEERIKEIRIEL